MTKVFCIVGTYVSFPSHHVTPDTCFEDYTERPYVFGVYLNKDDAMKKCIELIEEECKETLDKCFGPFEDEMTIQDLYEMALDLASGKRLKITTTFFVDEVTLHD